jgi:DNA-binding transcriptional LysR family regulator
MVGTLFLPLLAEFMRTHAAIDFHLDLSDRMVDVVAEGFDAVLRTGEPDDSALSARALGSWPMILVASPAYLSQRGRPERPADLAAHSCLHHCFNATGKLERWPLTWDAEDGEVELPVSMVSINLEGRLCFAESGLGIACLPEFSIRDALAMGRLEVVLSEYTEVRRVTFRILWPASRHPSPKVRALVDFLVERLQVA